MILFSPVATPVPRSTPSTLLRPFLLLIAVLAFISVVENILIHAYPISDSIVPLILLVFMSWGAARGVQQEWLHKVLVAVLLVVMLGSIVVNWNEWTLTS